MQVAKSRVISNLTELTKIGGGERNFKELNINAEGGMNGKDDYYYSIQANISPAPNVDFYASTTVSQHGRQNATVGFRVNYPFH